MKIVDVKFIHKVEEENNVFTESFEAFRRDCNSFFNKKFRWRLILC